jgi:hypothetical protein
MQPRHWRKLFGAMGKPYNDDLVFSLEELASYDIYDHGELIADVSGAASGEAQIEAEPEMEMTLAACLSTR